MQITICELSFYSAGAGIAALGMIVFFFLIYDLKGWAKIHGAVSGLALTLLASGIGLGVASLADRECGNCHHLTAPSVNEDRHRDADEAGE